MAVQVVSKPTEWDFILRSLKKEKTILFLGPHLLPNADGKPLSLAFYEDLTERQKHLDFLYNPKEGFFVFGQSSHKSKVLMEIGDFYSQTFGKELYGQIAEIPFPMVVTLMPDHSLENVMEGMSLPYQTAFFDKHSTPALEAPTKDKPLVYHLFGSYKKDESLILAYDDLFDYLKAIFGNDTLPTALRAAMSKAYDLVFLGFEFDKWYMQLLLNVLGLQDEKAGFVRHAMPKETTQDLTTYTLCTKHFRMEFVEEDEASLFIQRLYEKCNEENILRKPATPQAVAPVDARFQRKMELQKLLERQYSMKGEYENKLDLETDPRTKMKYEDEIDRISEDIRKYENELNLL